MYRLLRPFEYHEPETVTAAVDLLVRYGDAARVVAGGTDLVISMKKRELAPTHLVAIEQLTELDFLERTPAGGLRIGPLVTHAAVAQSPLVQEHYPMLAVASNEVGTPQIRNMGTIGGNVCKSGPSQDTPPVLVALEAELRLQGPSGERVVPMGDFCTGPFCTVLMADEVLTEIHIPPLPPRSAGTYKWCTKVTATDETLAGVAVVVVLAEDGTCADVRIGMGSVAPTATRAPEAEGMLRGAVLDPQLIGLAARMAAGECRPRSRPDYRRRMVRVLTEEAITELWEGLSATTFPAIPGGRDAGSAPGGRSSDDATGGAR